MKGSTAEIKRLREAEKASKGVGGSAKKLEIANDLERTLRGHKEAERVLSNLRQERSTHTLDAYLGRARKARSHVPWGGKTSKEEEEGECNYQ